MSIKEFVMLAQAYCW